MSNLFNFRDLGGLKGLDGRLVAKHRLLRAAQPVDLNTEEIETLKAHNLRHIVDLRTAHEAEKAPVSLFENIAYSHIDIMGQVDKNDADPKRWAEMFAQDPTAVEARFIDTYKGFSTSENARKGFGDFIKLCANLKEGAILFHCAAGKDRTGVAAAIILKILGVADQDIYTDYLETANAQEAIRTKLMSHTKLEGLSEAQLKAMGILFGVKESYLQGALDAATAAYGSFEDYLYNGLGVTPEDVNQIRELYLEAL